jgi:hypothetical protein
VKALAALVLVQFPVELVSAVIAGRWVWKLLHAVVDDQRRLGKVCVQQLAAEAGADLKGSTEFCDSWQASCMSC